MFILFDVDFLDFCGSKTAGSFKLTEPAIRKYLPLNLCVHFGTRPKLDLYLGFLWVHFCDKPGTWSATCVFLQKFVNVLHFTHQELIRYYEECGRVRVDFVYP